LSFFVFIIVNAEHWFCLGAFQLVNCQVELEFI